MALPGESLHKFLALVASVEGTDKCFRLAIYALKSLAAALVASNKLFAYLVPLMAPHKQRSFLTSLFQRLLSKLSFFPRSFASLAFRIEALIDPLVDTRICLRMFGTLAVLERFLTLWKSYLEQQKLSIKPHQQQQLQQLQKPTLLQPKIDPFTIRVWQLVSLSIYFPLEQIYFLAAKGVIPVNSFQTIHNLFRASNFAWLVYLVLDFVAESKEVVRIVGDMITVRRQIRALKYKENWSREVLSSRNLNGTPLTVSGLSGEISPPPRYSEQFTTVSSTTMYTDQTIPQNSPQIPQSTTPSSTTPSTASSTSTAINIDTSLQQQILKSKLSDLFSERDVIKWKLVSVVGDLPLAVNWCLREQWLSPLVVGGLGLVSSVAKLKLRWDLVADVGGGGDGESGSDEESEEGDD
ncbi:hypothetical protein HK098_007307 [Nowakowskiella sp. JEL0407]|nr:hypothetical protein HK098_007307 [Nowakowskiella sp. JEL0407]